MGMEIEMWEEEEVMDNILEKKYLLNSLSEVFLIFQSPLLTEHLLQQKKGRICWENKKKAKVQRS